MSSVLLYRWREKCKIYFVFVLGFFFPCATYECFNKSPNVYENVHTVFFWILFLGGNKHLMFFELITVMAGGEKKTVKQTRWEEGVFIFQATKTLFGPRRFPFQVTPISQLLSALVSAEPLTQGRIQRSGCVFLQPFSHRGLSWRN